MSALPCPVADRFAAADQTYATITEFLRSEEARQVKPSEMERQLEGMGRELLRKLLQAHLDMRQPGKAVEPVRDAAGTTLTPTPVPARSLESLFGEVEVARTGYGAAGTPKSAPAGRCAQSAAGEVLSGSAAASSDGSGQELV